MVRLGVAVIATTIALIAAELLTRAIDGYQVFSIGLYRIRDVQPTATPDRQYLPNTLAEGVSAGWYEQTPQVVRQATRPDSLARAASYPADSLGAFYWWNAEFIREQLCGHKDGAPGSLDDFYVFDPIDGQPYPRYRFLPHVTPPGRFTPNAFGWRGPEVDAERRANAIRIAFVGASTTIGNYSSKFSYPELVGYWLTLWAEAKHLPYRFEVINAARAGIEARSIEAIVRTEVLSVDPDLLVYYEGANNFAPSWVLKMPNGVPPRPTATFRQRSAAENYSALAGRIFDAILKSGHDGGEPPKPQFAFVWPSALSETDPDVTRTDLPIAMDVVVKSLDDIRSALSSSGADLALSSFVWLTDDGMRLDLSRHLTLFRFLNETYWPLSYAHIHRMIAFENAVYRNYARTYGISYLPLAETYPHDPDLFSDAIHLTDRGVRLQAWLFLQQLIPIIDAKIAARAWPKAPSGRRPLAAWAHETPRLVTRASVLASCPPVLH